MEDGGSDSCLAGYSRHGVVFAVWCSMCVCSVCVVFRVCGIHCVHVCMCVCI